MFEQNTKAIALLFRQKWLMFITFQSAIKINQWSNLVMFEQNTKAIALFLHHLSKNQSILNLLKLFRQNWFIFIFNLQSKSINFKFGHFEQNTKAIALPAHFHHLQSKSINFKFGHFWAKYGYSLTFSPKIIFWNLQSKSINFKFGHFWAKYQGYSLTFSPKIAHFHHSLFNFKFGHAIQIASINFKFGHFEQNTKAIALLLCQKLQSKSINFKFGHVWALRL